MWTQYGGKVVFPGDVAALPGAETLVRLPVLPVPGANVVWDSSLEAAPCGRLRTLSASGVERLCQSCSEVLACYADRQPRKFSPAKGLVVQWRQSDIEAIQRTLYVPYRLVCATRQWTGASASRPSVWVERRFGFSFRRDAIIGSVDRMLERIRSNFSDVTEMLDVCRFVVGADAARDTEETKALFARSMEGLRRRLVALSPTDYTRQIRTLQL